MDKEGLLPEIRKIVIKHPRKDDIMAKITRKDDCFAVSFDEKDERCGRCVLKVEYDGKAMEMRDVCKLLMKGGSVGSEKDKEKEKGAPAAGAPAADDPATAPAVDAPAEKDAPEKKVVEKKAPAEKKGVKAPAEKKGAKAPAEKKGAKAPAKPAKEKPAKKEGGRVSAKDQALALLKKKEMTQTELKDAIGIKSSGAMHNAMVALMDAKLIGRKEAEGRGFIYFAKG